MNLSPQTLDVVERAAIRACEHVYGGRWKIAPQKDVGVVEKTPLDAVSEFSSLADAVRATQ